MDLTSEEVKIIEKARQDARFWPYARWAFLLAAIGGVCLSFWLIDSASLDLLTSRQYYYARSIVLVFSMVLFALVVGRWGNDQTRLLLKLASENQVRSTK